MREVWRGMRQFVLRIGCYCNGAQQMEVNSKFGLDFSIPTFWHIVRELVGLALEVRIPPG